MPPSKYKLFKNMKMTEEYLLAIAKLDTKEDIDTYTNDVLKGIKKELVDSGIEFTENNEFVPNQVVRCSDTVLNMAKSYDEIQHLDNYLKGKGIVRLGNVDAIGGKWYGDRLEAHFADITKRFNDIVMGKK